MKRLLRHAYLAVGVAAWLLAGQTYGQITINEIVEDEQDFESTDIADTREFVELYNAGATAVDISGWLLNSVNLGNGLIVTTDPLPGGATIPAGGYYVIGAAGVPNVNFTPVAGELWTGVLGTPGGTGTPQNVIFELRNPNLAPGSQLVDAVATETFRGVELLNATQEQLDQIGGPGQTPGATARGGWWGQLESNNAHPSDTGPNAAFPNLPTSLSSTLALFRVLKTGLRK